MSSACSDAFWGAHLAHARAEPRIRCIAILRISAIRLILAYDRLPYQCNLFIFT